MEDAGKQAEQAAKLVKETAGKLSSYAAGVGRVIKESVEGPLSDTVQKIEQLSDATKEKVQQAASDVVENSKEAGKRAEAAIGIQMGIAAQVIKDKTEETKKLALEKLETAARVSKEQTKNATLVLKDKLVQVSGAIEEKTKELAKDAEAAVKLRAGEASQAIREKTEQQLTKMLASLKNAEVPTARADATEDFAKACKTVCGFEEQHAHQATKCEKTCLLVDDMKEEVFRMARKIDNLKSSQENVTKK